MGEWEQEPDRCADCGGTLIRRSADIDKPRIDQPLHYYVVGSGLRKRKVCAACWTTTKSMEK